jgi:DNA polymerase-4/DNA polymerase V
MSENTNNYLLTLSNYPKAIIHVDCDAFFTSCESAVRPSLKGKPLITGKERGIVSCASYEAKRLGVKRGMRLFEAERVCPGCVILPSDYETYSLYSERMFSILRRFTPEVEEYSIDEAFCDLSGLRRIYHCSYELIAKQIKETIEKELDLTVSIGLSVSKSLAKICSKKDKPSGLTCVPGFKLHQFLKGVKLEEVCGFGPNSVALLNKCGIRSVYDFVNKHQDFATKVLGKIGRELYLELKGIAVYEVSNEEVLHKYLSISKTKTFMPASAEREYVRAHLFRNMESAFIKLRRHKQSVKKITVFLKKQDFSCSGLEAELNRYSSSTMDFIDIVENLFNKIYKSKVLYRATGVILSKLANEGHDEQDLFDDVLKVEKLKSLSKVTDTLNNKFGKHTLHLGSTEFLKMRNSNSHPRANVSDRKVELLKGEDFRKRLNIPLLRLK